MVKKKKKECLQWLFVICLVWLSFSVVCDIFSRSSKQVCVYFAALWISFVKRVKTQNGSARDGNTLFPWLCSTEVFHTLDNYRYFFSGSTVSFKCRKFFHRVGVLKRRCVIAIFGSPQGGFRQILIKLDLCSVALKGAEKRPSTCFTSVAAITRQSLITEPQDFRADSQKGCWVWCYHPKHYFYCIILQNIDVSKQFAGWLTGSLLASFRNSRAVECLKADPMITLPKQLYFGVPSPPPSICAAVEMSCAVAVVICW